VAALGAPSVIGANISATPTVLPGSNSGLMFGPRLGTTDYTPQYGSMIAPSRAKILIAESEALPPQPLASQPAVIENTPSATNSIPVPAAIESPAAPQEKGSLPASHPNLAPHPTPAPDAAKISAEIKPPPPPPPPTPSQVLGLAGKDRTKAEKCLANAVYFEARSEPRRGQIAVAQVVMNRVFSPYYPKDVCSVVYQNSHQHLACQFTFTCDGKSKAITERGAWWRAQRVAKQTLDGKVWLTAVGKSTHYHAYWVAPAWVAEMKKMFHYGVHTFYRPHRWGDGTKEAGWVMPPQPASSLAQTWVAPPKEQSKPQPANGKKHSLPAKRQTKLSPENAQAKLLPTSSQAKLLPMNGQTKPRSTGAQTKPAPRVSTE
jgi:spore germination cell wall hydrolase CwlJ-like protein